MSHHEREEEFCASPAREPPAVPWKLDREDCKLGDPRFLALLEEMKALHCKKASDYGKDEDPLANLRASEEIGVPAWKGGWLRAKDKVKRIDQFCCKGKLENEPVEDSLMDLAAYCLLTLVLFREVNSRA